MKSVVLFSLVFMWWTLGAAAQKKKQNGKAVLADRTTTAAKKPDTTAVTLSSSRRYNAFAPDAGKRLQISDPTIKALNQRAAGAGVRITGSGIVGMPKGTYGFANGKLLLRTTTATTSGTSFGSGAVATGTSIFGAGASESALGVNGKSPYAGPWMWGSQRPAYSVGADSSGRR